MRNTCFTPVLCITGSDSTGGAGIQPDIRTISAMGGYAVTAVTTVAYNKPDGKFEIFDIRPDIIRQQIRTIISAFHPHTVKIGLLRTPETVKYVRDEIQACRNVILVPGTISASGRKLVDDQTVNAIVNLLLPEAMLLVVRCAEAERMTNHVVKSEQDMIQVAKKLVKFGAKSVLLRGARITETYITTLFFDGENELFFSSQNTEGWLMHGVSGALSSAIATRIALGDDIIDAIHHAHDYLHRQIVYSVRHQPSQQRPYDIYNAFIALVAKNHKSRHKIPFYAEQLNISTRYLSSATHTAVGKSPKDIIDEYLIEEIKVMLKTTNLNVQEIANRLGFSSQTVLCRLFKQITHKTPVEYRLS